MTTTPQAEALVYLLVTQQEAHRAPAISRLQNLAYILQETVPSPIKVRFRLRYGSPSSDDLYDSISHLRAAGYLRVSDSPGPGNLTRYVTTTDAPLPEQVRALVPHREQVDRVLGTLIPKTDREIDTMASVLMTNQVLAEDRRREELPAPTEKTVVDTVMSMKPKYLRRDISLAYRAATAIATSQPELGQDRCG